MLRSFVCLLLATLSLSYHRIDCADNDTEAGVGPAAAPTYIDNWLARDWRMKGPYTIIKWQYKFNRHRQFFYLTYLPGDDYVEITQVSTESPNAETLTCQYKFKAKPRGLKIHDLIVPDKAQKNDPVSFAFTTAEGREASTWYIAPVDFAKCRNDKLQKSEAAAAPAVQTEEAGEEAEAMSGDVPLSSMIANETSEANGKRATCQMDDERVEITCTQLDASGKKLMDNAKYKLPKDLKPDWFRVYNARSGAILVYVSLCPRGRCVGYRVVRLTPNGVDRFQITHGEMDLECSEFKRKLSADVAESDDGWVCLHAVCIEDYYKWNSTDKAETHLQYRRECLKGPLVD